MTGEPDERALKALTEKISQARGVCCGAYKDRCLRRRLAVRMRARGVHTYEAYSEVLDADAAEYDRLLDTLTINVTKFWRNAETWQALAPYLVELWRARNGHMRVWSAGCASGEEPYTLAVALAETARGLRENEWLARVRIDATDVDRESLERTQAGRVPRQHVQRDAGGAGAAIFHRRRHRRGHPPAAAGSAADREGAPPRPDARAASRPALRS